jgi:imidazolonepropionase-like amidohydrolase
VTCHRRVLFTPQEALKTATINPARYLGLAQSLGTVEQGKMADLVLLEANPLESIGNTRKISAVVVGGRLFLKPALDLMLAGPAKVP